MNLDRRLLQLARRSGWALALTIGLGFAAGVFTVLQAGAFSRVTARVFLDGQDRAQVSGLLALLLAAIAGRALLAWAGEISAAAVARRIKLLLRAALYRRLLGRGPAYLSGQSAGELSNTLLDGVEALDAYFSQYLPGLALAALIPLTFLVIVFPLDWVSGLALLLTAPLIPLFMILIGSAAQALTRRQWNTLSRMSAYFLDVLQGLAALKLLGRSRAQVGVMAQVSEQFRLVTMSVLRVTFLSALALEMLATLSTAVVAVQVGLRLLYGRLEFEQAFFVLLLAPEFYLPLRLLGTRFHAGMSGVAAAKRIFEILELPGGQTGSEAFETGEKANQPQINTDERRYSEDDFGAPAIRLEDVRFTYPQPAADGDLPADAAPAPAALNGVSLEIPAGGRVALVGPSGGGKSTLAALLLRFLEPDGGRILVDGRPLAAMDAAEWRERIAWLPQRPYLFHDSVLANLRLARPDAPLAAVIHATEQAGAHDFIQALPQGYETVIGEGGTRLSGGQAQRLALARAFLRDAPFIILDEPSASLDAESEAALQAALERLLLGRSALIIAHRLNTVRSAGRIYVLDAGRVAAAGTHAELLAAGGLYARLVQAYTGAPAGAGAPAATAPAPAEAHAAPPASPARLGFSNLLPGASGAAGGPQAGEALSGSVFLRLLGFLRPFWRWALLSALAGAATVLSGVGLMGASTYIICAAALHPSVAELQVAIVGVRAFGISRGLFRYLERYLAHETTFRLLARLRVWFYAALEPLAPARLAGMHSGDLLARILGDIESLENFYVRVAAPPLTALISGGVIWFLLWRFDAGIAAAWLGCWLAAGIGVPLLARRLGRAPGRESVLRRAELSAALVAGVQGLPDLLAFGQGEAWLGTIAAHSERLAAAQRRSAWVSGLQTAAGSALSNFSLWLTAFLAIPLVRDGRMEGVFLAVAALIAQTGFEAVLPLPAAAQFLEANLHAARRLFDVVDARPAVSDPPAPLPAPASADLRVRGINFSYPPYSINEGDLVQDIVLHEIAFDLPPGKRLAIVGPSGAGKSTLIHLLARFYEYDRGEILLDGRELRAYRQEDVRRMLAVLPQRAYLFSASLADNLRLADPKATPERLEAAARLAGLHDFIQTLPLGYATWIGEGGVRLSGGQRQRLALARALLRDAPLALLDEPTAGLDPVAEREVLVAIFGALEGRSLIWVTHRLIEMQRVDEILVFDRGRIVQRGAHAELVGVEGMYRRLWQGAVSGFLGTD